MDADLWVNGEYVGNHFYGYSPFWVDVTDLLIPGGDNVIALRVHAEGVTSRWYSGAGIYRPVTLLECDREAHVLPFSTKITVEGDADTALVSVATCWKEPGRIADAECLILDASGQTVAMAPMTGGRASLVLPSPSTWSPDTPFLSRLQIFARGHLADEQSFGVRFLEFRSREGFFLNGSPVLLKGGCVHHDNGALGSMAFDKAEIRKVRLLKDAGFNAVRTAHNPPSEAFLAACDSLGMLVLLDLFDVWRYPHFEGDYSSRFDACWKEDVRSTVDRFFNHPSILLWGSGNEIKRNDTEEMAALSQEITRFLHQLDPSRPVFNAVNSVGPGKDAFLQTLDVAGYNYSREAYLEEYRTFPDQLVISTESFPSEAFAYWTDVEEYPWVIGDFVWTAFDYMGEASIGWYGYDLRDDFFPWYLAYCGDVDICGQRRPQSYFRQTLWDERPMVYLTMTPPTPSFPHNPRKQEWSVWDWPDEIHSWTGKQMDGKPVRITVYSNCPVVELFQDGKSLGVRRNTENRFRWEAAFRPGTLTAVGMDAEGVPLCRDELSTASELVSLMVRTDTDHLVADGEDLCFVTLSLTDSSGRVNPLREDRITLDVQGPGELIAFTNANPMDVSGFQSPVRRAWRGEALAIVRAGREKGLMTIRAESETGLSASVSLNVN